MTETAPAYDAAEDANRTQWTAQLDAAAAPPDNVIDASDRFGAVQLRATCAAQDPAAVQQHAAAGVAGTAGALPHLDVIQASFGAHDVTGIRAHVGGAAADASAAIGAEAYATGNDVAFAESPSLLVAAHEAAHVVQQRAGVALPGGVGIPGDAYEQHADAVAEKVVRGESAMGLLGGPTSGATSAVQLHGKGKHERSGEMIEAFEDALDSAKTAIAKVKRSKDRLDVLPAQLALLECHTAHHVLKEHRKQLTASAWARVVEMKENLDLLERYAQPFLEGANPDLKKLREEKEAETRREEAKQRVASESDEDRLTRNSLLSDIVMLSRDFYDRLIDGVHDAVKKLGKVSKSSHSVGLLDYAATAAIAGTASFVAISLAEEIAINDVSKEVVDSIKEMVKTALKSGMSAAPSIGEEDLLTEFKEAQRFKLNAARSLMTHQYWTENVGDLYYIDLPGLRLLAENMLAFTQLEELSVRQERSTSIEWINFLARTRHGAEPVEPSEGQPAPAMQEGPAHRNVADDGSAASLVYDDSQRKMQDDHYGLLEVHLAFETLGHLEEGEEPDFWLFEHTGHGMRMDNVNEYGRSQLQKCGTVGDAPVNKIVRVYWDFSLNPPKPGKAVLVTADGVIRAESFHEAVPDSITRAALRYANSLSLKKLQ